jgi:hypothetical protein
MAQRAGSCQQGNRILKGLEIGRGGGDIGGIDQP